MFSYVGLIRVEIAKEAARDYNFITGKPPTRSKNRDGYPVFLAAIFAVLNKKNDSADNWARQACEESYYRSLGNLPNSHCWC